MTYPPEGGYNPGDTWELFVGADNHIQEFRYHRSRDATHITVMSWKDYRKAGPLLVSLNRQGALKGKPLRVFFSDVSVKLVGSNSWVNALRQKRVDFASYATLFEREHHRRSLYEIRPGPDYMEYMHGKGTAGMILKEPAGETRTIAAFRTRANLSLGPGLTLAP